MYHFPKPFEDNVKSKRERKRERKQHRKSSARQSHDDNNLCGTFPVLVEPKLTRHRSRRKHFSPDPVESSQSPGETDYSDYDEIFGIGCANRENNGARAKHNSTKNGEEKQRPRRPRKKKKRGNKSENEGTPYVPVFADRPPSRNGVGFHLDSGPYRNVTLMSKRRSAENFFGLGGALRETPPPPRSFDLPAMGERPARMKLKPHKLPPIDQAKRRP